MWRYGRFSSKNRHNGSNTSIISYRNLINQYEQGLILGGHFKMQFLVVFEFLVKYAHFRKTCYRPKRAYCRIVYIIFLIKMLQIAVFLFRQQKPKSVSTKHDWALNPILKDSPSNFGRSSPDLAENRLHERWFHS